MNLLTLFSSSFFCTYFGLMSFFFCFFWTDVLLQIKKKQSHLSVLLRGRFEVITRPVKRQSQSIMRIYSARPAPHNAIHVYPLLFLIRNPKYPLRKPTPHKDLSIFFPLGSHARRETTRAVMHRSILRMDNSIRMIWPFASIRSLCTSNQATPCDHTMSLVIDWFDLWVFTILRWMKKYT